MQSINTVLKQYIPSSVIESDSGPIRRTVSYQRALPVDIEVRKSLPMFFREVLAQSGREESEYKVYGGVGEPNRYVAKIPWVAILNRKITTSTTRGFYIALLFREDMQGIALSLNQGFRRFSDVMPTDLAHRKIRECAAHALLSIDFPSDFVKGPIDLAATGDMGIGYQDGAILSKVYMLDTPIVATELAADCQILLDRYDSLFRRVGPDIPAALCSISEDEFQEAATVNSVKPSTGYQTPPAGRVLPKPRVGGRTSSTYQRDVKAASQAIKNANYLCEFDSSHQTFVSKATGMNFVEAHHLVPMGNQDEFDACLDLLENIVALCPLCHRKLHHGRIQDKHELLDTLFHKRASGLEAREIKVNRAILHRLYKSDFVE